MSAALSERLMLTDPSLDLCLPCLPSASGSRIHATVGQTPWQTLSVAKLPGQLTPLTPVRYRSFCVLWFTSGWPSMVFGVQGVNNRANFHFAPVVCQTCWT